MRVETCLIEPAAGIPNNPRLPLLHYHDVVAIEGSDPASAFEALFARHGWSGSWRNGIFAFHHYHATAHEVLGIYSGEVEVCFGGPDGVQVTARPGDVVVVPAGVAHKRLALRGTLGVVGAYPLGQAPDLCRADSDAAGGAAAVARVPKPAQDPVCGVDGPLVELWNGRGVAAERDASVGGSR